MKFTELEQNKIYERTDKWFGGEIRGIYKARIRGNKIVSARRLFLDNWNPLSFSGVKIVSPEESSYWVAIDSGETFPVKHLGKYSSIASVAEIFNTLGFSTHVIWTPKEKWATWSRRWSKKLIKGNC